MNAPASIFCTRFGGTDGPGVCAKGSALLEAVVWFGRSKLTWSRSRPEEVGGGGYQLDGYDYLNRCVVGQKLQRGSYDIAWCTSITIYNHYYLFIHLS